MVLAPDKMYRPTDIAFGGAGIVFVVDQFNHRVSKWTYTQPSYTFTLDGTWGSNGDGTSGVGGPIGNGGSSDNSLYRPTGIAFDSTNTVLYVTDTFHDRVRVINVGDGAFIESFGSSGFGDANFYRPAGIAIETDSDTSIVIADELNHRAVRYDTNGGSPNNETVLVDPSDNMVDLSFVRPHGVVYDVTQDSYNIGDSQRGLISSYLEGGAFVNQFGTPGSTGHTGSGDEIFFPGSGEGLLDGTALTVFADTRNNALKTMNNEVVAVVTGATSTTAIAGTGDGQFYYPESVSAFTDTEAYVLAANTLNNRIETFSSAASVLTAQAPFNFGKPE